MENRTKKLNGFNNGRDTTEGVGGCSIIKIKTELDETPFEDIPKGWISIESHLPMFLADDIFKGGTTYKVKDIDGNEFEAIVSDQHVFYQIAKNSNITHWLNK